MQQDEACQTQGTNTFKLSLGYAFFKKDFIYLFLEGGEGREKGRERNIDVQEKHPSACPQLGTCPATQARALTEINLRPFRLQASARFTAPH